MFTKVCKIWFVLICFGQLSLTKSYGEEVNWREVRSRITKEIREKVDAEVIQRKQEQEKILQDTTEKAVTASREVVTREKIQLLLQRRMSLGDEIFPWSAPLDKPERSAFEIIEELKQEIVLEADAIPELNTSEVSLKKEAEEKYAIWKRGDKVSFYDLHGRPVSGIVWSGKVTGGRIQIGNRYIIIQDLDEETQAHLLPDIHRAAVKKYVAKTLHKVKIAREEWFQAELSTRAGQKLLANGYVPRTISADLLPMQGANIKGASKNSANPNHWVSFYLVVENIYERQIGSSEKTLFKQFAANTGYVFVDDWEIFRKKLLNKYEKEAFREAGYVFIANNQEFAFCMSEINQYDLYGWLPTELAAELREREKDIIGHIIEVNTNTNSNFDLGIFPYDEFWGKHLSDFSAGLKRLKDKEDIDSYSTMLNISQNIMDFQTQAIAKGQTIMSKSNIDQKGIILKNAEAGDYVFLVYSRNYPPNTWLFRAKKVEGKKLVLNLLAEQSFVCQLEHYVDQPLEVVVSNFASYSHIYIYKCDNSWESQLNSFNHQLSMLKLPTPRNQRSSLEQQIGGMLGSYGGGGIMTGANGGSATGTWAFVPMTSVVNTIFELGKKSKNIYMGGLFRYLKIPPGRYAVIVLGDKGRTEVVSFQIVTKQQGRAATITIDQSNTFVMDVDYYDR